MQTAFERAVGNAALLVDVNRVRQFMLGLALVEADLAAAAQLGAFEPIHSEQRSFDAADLLQSKVEPVLPLVAAEFLEHHRGGHRARLDRRRQADDVVPALPDQINPDRLSEQRLQPFIRGCRLDHAEPPVTDVAQTGRKAVAEQMTERKHMIVRAARVGVVFLQFERRPVMQQAVEHVRRFAGRRRDHFAAERAVLIRHVRIEQHAGVGAVFGVDTAVAATASASTKILPVRG